MPRRSSPSSHDAHASLADVRGVFARLLFAVAAIVARVFAAGTPALASAQGVLIVLALAGAGTSAVLPGLEGLRDPARRDPFEATDAVMRPSEARGSDSHAAQLDDRVDAERTTEEPALPGLECDEDDEPLEEFAGVPATAHSSEARASRGRPLAPLGASIRVCAGFASRRDRPPHA